MADVDGDTPVSAHGSEARGRKWHRKVTVLKFRTSGPPSFITVGPVLGSATAALFDSHGILGPPDPGKVPTCWRFLDTMAKVLHLPDSVAVHVHRGWNLYHPKLPRLTYHLTATRDGVAAAAVWAEYYPPTDKSTRSRVAYINRVHTTGRAEKYLFGSKQTDPSLAEFLVVGFTRYMQVVAGAREVRLWIDPYADLIFNTGVDVPSDPEALRKKVYEPWFIDDVWGWTLTPASFPGVDWPIFTDGRKDVLAADAADAADSEVLRTALSDISKRVKGLQNIARTAFKKANVFVVTFPLTHVVVNEVSQLAHETDTFSHHHPPRKYADLYVEMGGRAPSQAEMEQMQVDDGSYRDPTETPVLLDLDFSSPDDEEALRADKEAVRAKLVQNTKVFLDTIAQHSTLETGFGGGIVDDSGGQFRFF